MRLGRFWGITGPMLVIATKKHGIENIKPLIKAVETNSEIMNDLKSELVFLYDAVNKIPKKYSVPDGFQTIESFDQSIRYVKGKLFAEDVDEQEFYMNFTVGCVLQMLRKNIKTGMQFELPVETVSSTEDEACLSNRINVIQSIKEVISQEDFYLSGIKKVYRKIINKFKTNGTGCDMDSLAKSFMLVTSIPENFIIDGETVTFSQDELQLVDFFVNSQDTIRELLVNLKVEEVKENKIFGRSFRDLIQGKPNSLYWIVQEKFEIVRSKNNGSFLTSLLKELKIDVEKFEYSITTEVIPADKYKSVKTSMDSDSYYKKLELFSPAKSNYFKNLVYSGYVKIEDLIEENFNLLSDIYDIISDLGIVELNRFFDLEYTRSDWEDLIIRLNKLGICGINLYSMELYRVAIENMTFISNNYIIKDKKQIEEFSGVLENIKALLNTVKPVGTVLE